MKQFVLFSLTLLLFAACDHRTGSGNIVTEKRQTSSFTGINVGGAFTVEIRKGPAIEVEVESDDNLIGLIETRVSGNTLRIKTTNGNGFNNAHFKVFVTAPEITSLNVSGAANVKSMAPLESGGKISLDVSGAGEITTEVDAPEVYAEVSGAATINLNGRTRDYKAKVSGSGQLKSGRLQSENTEVRVSGAGMAKVHASQNLKADASGAGNIYYKGGATVQQKTSGAGNIKKDS